MKDPIVSLLKGDYLDPQTGEKLGVSLKSVVIEESLEGREADLVADLGFGRKIAVVCDPETLEAMGARVERALSSRFDVQRVLLPSHPHPDEDTLERLLATLNPGLDAIVAVGSGSINDLCKVAAHRRGIPQAIFGTAPSMNGYTSANAAITVGGLKKTLPAIAPTGVFLDLAVLARAPKRLIRSGLGDSLCRPTAQADWLMASLLLGQKYREAPFAMLAADEVTLFSEPRALLAGDLSAMRALARTLVLSGFGMTICGGSYPASQGEHLISHYMDMMGRGLPESYHGEQIGVTALEMARLQEAVLRRDRAPRLRATAVSREEVLAHFGPAVGEACWKEFEPKRLSSVRAEELNAKLASEWDAIRARVAAVTKPSGELAAVLAAAEAPRTASDLGWPEGLYRDAVAHSREIRNRWTFLDFAGDLAD